MKLKKITAYIQTDGPSGEAVTIIPSGFSGAWIYVSEDCVYNIGVKYLIMAIREINDAIKEAE